MRPVALILRAGAVVVLAAAGVAALVDGAPRPAVVPQAVAAPDPAADGIGDDGGTKRVIVPKRRSPSALVAVAATGDIGMGSAPDLPRDGGRSFFSAVQADLAGDVVLGNLEGTLSTGGSPICAPPSASCDPRQTPPSYARWLARAGFTVLNLANDHAHDFGARGLRQTIAALDGVRVAHTGRPGQIAVQQVGDVRVAIVGFAANPWSASLTDLPAARALVRKASQLADVVIVTMHGGTEGADRQRVPLGAETSLGKAQGDLRRFSHAVVDAGADLVVGHGPRVLRGMEWYRGRLITYSLGVFGSYGRLPQEALLATSGILRVTLRGDGTFESGTLVPTRLAGRGVPALDPTEAAHGIVRSLSRDDFGARAVRVDANGGLTPPASS